MGDAERLRALLGEHYLKLPKDIFCACGVAFPAISFEDGLQQWVEHVMKEFGWEDSK